MDTSVRGSLSDEIVMRVDSGANVVAAAEVAQTVITRLAGHQGFDVIVPREILRQKQFDRVYITFLRHRGSS